MKTLVSAALIAAFIGVAGAPASAQTFGAQEPSAFPTTEPTVTSPSFDAPQAEAPSDAPPGVRYGYSEFGERDIEVVRPFGDTVTDSQGQQFAPLNEFAGQTRRSDPGLLGEALGRVRQSITDAFEQQRDE